MVGSTVCDAWIVGAWVVEIVTTFFVAVGSGNVGTITVDVDVDSKVGSYVPHRFVPQAERSIPIRTSMMPALYLNEFIGQIIPHLSLHQLFAWYPTWM
jgi:hypothetical protein